MRRVAKQRGVSMPPRCHPCAVHCPGSLCAETRGWVEDDTVVWWLLKCSLATPVPENVSVNSYKWPCGPRGQVMIKTAAICKNNVSFYLYRRRCYVSVSLGREMNTINTLLHRTCPFPLSLGRRNLGQLKQYWTGALRKSAPVVFLRGCQWWWLASQHNLISPGTQ